MERAKLLPTGLVSHDCSCTIQQSFRLLCYYTIKERQRNKGVILLNNIHRHWYYYRPNLNSSSPDNSSINSSIIPWPILNPVCNKGRLTASDCQEGNRRDCSMSGNQTSGNEGGVQCVMTVVCIYVCLISYISD